jgi:uncharacterized membrane protein YphA (DoxX/SURF4 family)
VSGLADWIARCRARRSLNLLVANLRILIGFGFLPAGLRKVLGERFTDADNVGPFHDFLHAFWATGPLYRFVGIVQLTGALLLMTQRFATVGAALLLPVLSVIVVFVWSTAGVPTIATATLMLCGVAALLLWDLHKWRAVFDADREASAPPLAPAGDVVDTGLWQRAGLAVALLYFASCLLHGGVYRPRGADWSEPAFYILPAVTLVPLLTLLLDHIRHRRAPALGQPPGLSRDRSRR